VRLPTHYRLRLSVNDPTRGEPKEEKVVSLRSLRSMWLKGSEFFNAKPAEGAERLEPFLY
jgi:hypothetical protein